MKFQVKEINLHNSQQYEVLYNKTIPVGTCPESLSMPLLCSKFSARKDSL